MGVACGRRSAVRSWRGTPTPTYRAPSVNYTTLEKLELHVRDLWAHADRGRVADGFTAKVPSHGVVMLRVSR